MKLGSRILMLFVEICAKIAKFEYRKFGIRNQGTMMNSLGDGPCRKSKLETRKWSWNSL